MKRLAFIFIWRTAVLLVLLLLFTRNSNGQSLADSSRETDVYFKPQKTHLDTKAKNQLDSAAAIVKKDTSLGIRVTTYYADMCDKCGALAWERLRVVYEYLKKAGVHDEHILSYSVLEGELNKATVSIVEWTPLINEPPPPPNLRKKQTVPSNQQV